MTTNEEIGDFMKIVKYFEKLGFTIKAVTKKIKNESKKLSVSLLLSKLGASLSKNLLTDKGV